MTSQRVRDMSEEQKEWARKKAREWYAKPENRARQEARIAERRKDPAELEKIREQQRAYSQAWRDRNPEKRRAAWIRSKYQLTEGQYAAFLAHSGICDSCGQEPAKDIDHCHERNIYRGYLCHGCNVAAGMLADDPVRAEALAAYLRRVAVPPTAS